MIIVLMGYMGSGKSTIGRELSKILDFTFIDLDDFISEKTMMSVNDIFESKGELYFRKKENEFLSDILKNQKNIVLSLGGGTPCYANNLHLINSNKNTTSIYLKTSIKILFSRLRKELNRRPLISHLNSDNDLIEFIGKHLFERAQFYEKANKVIKTDDRIVKEIVEDIILHLV